MQQDKDFGAKWLASGNDSPEGRLMDALNKRALGMAPDKPAAPRDENAEAVRALGAPVDISGYDLSNIRGADGGFVHLDEPTRKLANGELLPEARALDLSSVDVALIAGNVTRPVSYEDCEAALHRLWGESFEAGLNDFRLAMAGSPKARALLEQFPETLGNNPMLISAVVAAYRRQQGRR